jgi:DNA-binding transcriptional LysR family regulator
MIVRNFEYLLALNQERHFARAAAACRVSQPTLSAGIKQLEEDMDARIVRRGQRFEGFTPEGERVLAWAQQMLDDCMRLKQELHSFRESAMQGAFRIGALPGTTALAALMSVPFSEQAPNLQISIETGDVPKLLHRLRQHELDIALTYVDDLPMDGLTKHLLYQERMYFFTSDPIEGSRLTWNEVVARPLCLLESAFPPAMAARLQRAEKVLHTDSSTVLAAHVASGRWSTVLPQSLAATLQPAATLHAYPIRKTEEQVNVGFVTAREEPLPPAVHAWMELAHTPDIVAAIRNMLKAHEIHMRR